MRARRRNLAVALLAVTACSREPRDQFWVALQFLCGQAFEGHTVQSVPPDSAMERARLVMHVRDCRSNEIRIPFHVGDNRSRTWILTRTEQGLTLKHDHRHEDGTADSITMYGGDTRDPGTATSQDFHADDHTAQLIPAARTNVWTLEIEPGRSFVYALRREGTERRFRAEFDLTTPVPAPPPPWGTEEPRTFGQQLRDTLRKLRR